MKTLFKFSITTFPVFLVAGVLTQLLTQFTILEMYELSITFFVISLFLIILASISGWLMLCDNEESN